MESNNGFLWINVILRMWYNITVIMHGCKLNVNMETMKCMAVNINIGIQFMGTMHGSF